MVARSVAKLSVEGSEVTNLVVLLARCHPRRRRAELERDEARTTPVFALRMKLADIVAVGGEELCVVATWILNVLQRDERVARKKEVIA